VLLLKVHHAVVTLAVPAIGAIRFTMPGT